MALIHKTEVHFVDVLPTLPTDTIYIFDVLLLSPLIVACFLISLLGPVLSANSLSDLSAFSYTFINYFSWHISKLIEFCAVDKLEANVRINVLSNSIVNESQLQTHDRGVDWQGGVLSSRGTQPLCFGILSQLEEWRSLKDSLKKLVTALLNQLF